MKLVECEVHGGPLDGAIAQVREFECGICKETHYAYEFPAVVRSLPDLIWLARQKVNYYVPDLVLKRLVWTPEVPKC